MISIIRTIILTLLLRGCQRLTFPGLMRHGLFRDECALC